MRRHIWTRGAIGGGWLHQTRPVGKSTWSFLPTRPSPRHLEVGHGVRLPQRRHTVHTGLFKHVLPADFVCAGAVLLRGCVWLCERGAPSLRCLGVCSTACLCRAPGRALSLCGSPSQLLLGTWGPPGSQIKPMSPALAGRLFTTRETPYRCSLQNDIFLSSFTSIALTVTSNARVSLHTDSVSGETTAGVL